jgi:DNA (cytosine-5)-methyltransferase 1
MPADGPAPTITAGGFHVAEVRAFLIKYYGAEAEGHDLDAPMGTVTTKDRFGLVIVTIGGIDYAIVDIGMRMLTPLELAAAQGFPPGYVLDPIVDGKPLTKTAQVRMIGNSVSPPMAEAEVAAMIGRREAEARAA